VFFSIGLSFSSFTTFFAQDFISGVTICPAKRRENFKKTNINKKFQLKVG